MSQLLQEFVPVLIFHIIMIEVSSFELPLFCRKKASIATVELVILPKDYKTLEDVFSTENADHLPLDKNHDYSIQLVDSKQPL